MIIVSACLAGVNCRYNGRSKPNDKVIEMVMHGEAIPLCPEQLGGLTTPRRPCERIADKVKQNDGTDVTENLKKGAEETLRIAQLIGAKEAIFKTNSAACGSGKIYDGTFSSVLIDGDGVVAELLKKNGIRVITQEEL